MKTSEYRIGNYLQDGLTKELLQVCELSENKISSKVVDRSKFPLPEGWFNEPIPLTEEWLLRLGAEAIETPHDIQYRIKDRLFVLRGFVFCDYGSGVKILYVHQLQNLYFALTQTELVCQ